jgi:hypothetical protein
MSSYQRPLSGSLNRSGATSSADGNASVRRHRSSAIGDAAACPSAVSRSSSAPGKSLPDSGGSTPSTHCAYGRQVTDIRILSLLLEAEWNTVAPVALIRVDAHLDDVRAYWQLKARDGISRELRNVTELSWSPDTVRSILTRNAIIASGYEIAPDEWHGTARMRLLQSLFNRYALEDSIKRLHRSTTYLESTERHLSRQGVSQTRPLCPF